MSYPDAFERAFKFTLGYEGANCYTVPGEDFLTCWGLAKPYNPEVYEGMTLEEAKDIYFRKYWQATGCDDLPLPLAIVHFDSSVNPGQGAAARFLRESGGDVEKYLVLRLHYYTNLTAKWPLYGKGWTRRVADLLRYVDEVEPAYQTLVLNNLTFADLFSLARDIWNDRVPVLRRERLPVTLRPPKIDVDLNPDG